MPPGHPQPPAIPDDPDPTGGKRLHFPEEAEAHQRGTSPQSICDYFDNGSFSSAMPPKPSPAGHLEGVGHLADHTSATILVLSQSEACVEVCQRSRLQCGMG